MAISGDGESVYVGGTLDSAVATFVRSPTTGSLTFVEAIHDSDSGVDGLDGTCSISISPNGDHLYVAGKNDNAVAVFSRHPLKFGGLTFLEAEVDGVNGVDGLDGAQAVAISPDGGTVYAAGFYDDAVVVLFRDQITGLLTFFEVHKDGFAGVDGLDGALGVTVSPDNNHVYAVGKNDDAVVVFSRLAPTGQLTYLESHFDGVAGVDGLDFASAVVVSPDGNNVYVSGYFDNAIAVFERDPVTGSLTWLEVVRHGVDGVLGLESPRAVTLGPDGTQVYATSEGGDLTVFDRDPLTGLLTYDSSYRNGVEGVTGLGEPFAVVASSDGKSVYATGDADDAVVVFKVRDGTGRD